MEQSKKAVEIIDRSTKLTKRRVEKKRAEVEKISVEVAKEVQTLQEKIIKERLLKTSKAITAEAAQTSKTESPYADAEELQNIFSLEVSKTRDEGTSVKKEDLARLTSYKSYMTANDADSYNEILRELATFVDSKDILSETEVVSSVLSEIREESLVESLRDNEDLDFDLLAVVERFKKIRDDLSVIFTQTKKITEVVNKSGVLESNAPIIIKTILDDVFSEES